MNQNKFTFDTDNLVVDWISFKFQHLDKINQIADYFFKKGFNSYQQSAKYTKPVKEPIFITSDNEFEVLFVKELPYWKGMLIQFSGSNAKHFYDLVKKRLVNWEMLSPVTLARFDLYYSRDNIKKDKISVQEFFENCHQKCKQTNKNVIFEKNIKGLILKIGNRRSNHYFRIYQEKNSLKFEYEMKGRFLEKYSSLLTLNCLEQFEHKLSKQFLLSFGSILSLNYSFVNWLVKKLRPAQKQKLYLSGLKIEYLDFYQTDFQLSIHRKNFFNFLHFINYIQTLDYEIDSLKSTYYRLVSFEIQDFLKYKKESNNHYQLKKSIQFFDQLQTNFYIKFFSSNQYRTLVTIPEVKIERKGKQNAWIATIWIVEELFNYTYPFLFPDLLKRKLTKHEFEVQFKFIIVFTFVDIEKIFYIKDFLESYKSTLSNKQKTEIKKYFIELVKVFEEKQLISSNYKIISGGKVYKVDKLTPANISEGFIIYEKISI